MSTNNDIGTDGLTYLDDGEVLYNEFIPFI